MAYSLAERFLSFHSKKVHRSEPEPVEVECTLCGTSRMRLDMMYQHIEEKSHQALLKKEDELQAGARTIL